MNAVPGQKGNLLFIHDSHNDVEWLIDSGAAYYIVPPSMAQRTQGPQPNYLQAANGSTIACFGDVEKTLTLGNKTYKFDFVVADVKHHILGADFLSQGQPGGRKGPKWPKYMVI